MYYYKIIIIINMMMANIYYLLCERQYKCLTHINSLLILYNNSLSLELL